MVALISSIIEERVSRQNDDSDRLAVLCFELVCLVNPPLDLQILSHIEHEKDFSRFQPVLREIDSPSISSISLSVIATDTSN